ncbi:MAG: hypothetical protein JSW34_10545 [Candidatus Zixiibacteriota bacterium]|nr:MAG: hypothetical protein JSW34_10545 [candidate division Zixibacteria bacterium]
MFIERVSTELKRAERYRIFVSLIILDVSFLQTLFPNHGSSLRSELAELVGKHIRSIDDISILGSGKLGLLFPETTRQGAEIASRRITELIHGRLSEMNAGQVEHVIPLEMASYPDAAGAMSITDFLRDYSQESLN